MGIIAWYLHSAISYYNGNAVIFFLLMVTAFLIGTFCLLASCLVSLSTGGIISKTIYVSLICSPVQFALCHFKMNKFLTKFIFFYFVYRNWFTTQLPLFYCWWHRHTCWPKLTHSVVTTNCITPICPLV